MIKIIIDSASDISQEEAQKMGITVIPLDISFGEESFKDGVDLSKKEFYEKLIKSEEFPKTSQININTFEEYFGKIMENDDEAICITLSSKLSGTYANAVNVANKYNNKILVCDSLSAATGERILCEYALQLIKEGYSINEIFEKLEQKKQNIVIMAALDTLKYLRKGGRISSLVAFAGEILAIKPIVAIKKGEVKLIGKAIGSKRAMKFLTNEISSLGIDFNLSFGLFYSGLSDETIKRYIEDNKNLWGNKVNNVFVSLIGSTIGTHIGPNAVGIAFFASDKNN